MQYFTVLLSSTEGVKLAKLQGNNTKYGGPGIASSAGCLYAGEVETELKRAVNTLRENRVNVKVHEWILELCRVSTHQQYFFRQCFYELHQYIH